MAKGILQHIASDFNALKYSVIRIENPDGFLKRDDVVQAFSVLGVVVNFGSKIEQRIAYELRDKTKCLILLSDDNTDYLEDILSKSNSKSFHLDDYIEGFHINTVLKENIDVIDGLYNSSQLINLNRIKTEDFIAGIKAKKNNVSETFKLDTESITSELEKLLNQEKKDWKSIIQLVSYALLHSIDKSEFSEIFTVIQHANEDFQDYLISDYPQLKNSNPIKKPLIVSKILDHLNFKGVDAKIALIVVDGMSYWQYLILRESFSERTTFNEEITHSWIPSITQLSRQAIFRGDVPKKDYRQNPQNEERLWKSYWKSKGINACNIRYNHDKVNLSGLDSVLKFGIVYTDLDVKMHGSSDYKDLIDLTNNWISRSRITKTINTLIDNSFSVYLTTDHGNIQARGWRGLKGKEKLGTNQSGSRSQRHIEYSEQWLADDFITSNPEIANSIVNEDNVIYFKKELSFSKEESLITHGGSHILEVLIPFIQIKDE